MNKYRYFITYSYTEDLRSLCGSCMVDMNCEIKSNHDLNTVYKKLVKRDELVTALEDTLHCSEEETASYDWCERKEFLDLTILSFKLIKVK